MPTPRWDLGQILYMKVNEEPGMLTGYVVRSNGAITYLVSWFEEGEKECWEMELSDEITYRAGKGEED